MSRLPEKGEVNVAAEAMNARMRAAAENITEGETFDVGLVSVNRKTRDTNDMEFGIRGVYGDLFDVGEMIASAAGLIEMFIADIATGRRDVMSACVSMYLMAAGQGVLIERGRWERGDG